MLLVLAVVVGACGGGDDAPDPADELARRLVAVLEADGSVVDGDLSTADVVCPDVRAREPGNTATCTLTFADGRIVDVDMEFQEDGAFTVTALQER